MERIYIIEEYSGTYETSRIISAYKSGELAKKEVERLKEMIDHDNDDRIIFVIVDTILR